MPSAEIIMHPALVDDENPEKLAARCELRVLIEAAIGELPEPFRVVFVLREVEAMSTEETAQLLQIAPETVRSRLHRAKQRLRLALDREIASALTDSFPFAGARCAAMSARVIARMESEGLISHALRTLHPALRQDKRDIGQGGEYRGWNALLGRTPEAGLGGVPTMMRPAMPACSWGWQK